MTVTGKVQKFRMREMAVAELGLGEAAAVRDGVTQEQPPMKGEQWGLSVHHQPASSS